MGSGKDIERLKRLIRRRDQLTAEKKVKHKELIEKCKNLFGDDFKIDEDTRGRIMRERKKMEMKKKQLVKKIEDIERKIYEENS
ncbi:MAG: hypothetical protein GF317_12700 [Candidatus Lokiarchaeota archaeon]|nr:hypothetical protein [Candidatus Lokiarchaeota archaeon]